MKIIIPMLVILSLLMAPGLQGQKKNSKVTLTGFIVDSRQYPVPNAIIIIDDIKTDNLTDEQGYYRVRIKNSAQKIGIFTFTGVLMEEQIGGRTRINFALPEGVPPGPTVSRDIPDNEEIDIGYAKVKRDELTTPVNKIDGRNKKFASYSSIYEMIKGEVPGVQVRGKSIRIQGINSFTMSNEPLFVVDGIQVSYIDDIPPQVVESIQILKGASAAIYGSRGANGVILINTIKPKSKK